MPDQSPSPNQPTPTTSTDPINFTFTSSQVSSHPTPPSTSGSHRHRLFTGLASLVVTGGLVAATLLVQQNQDIRQQAKEPVPPRFPL